jgi:TldD protein
MATARSLKPPRSAPPSLGTPTPPLLAVPTVERLLSLAMARGATFGEVYVERTTLTAISMDEGRVRSAQVGVTMGVGVRAVNGIKVGYAFSDDLDDAALDRAARTAALIASGQGSERGYSVSQVATPQHYRVPKALEDEEVQRKVDLAVRAERAARKHDSRIKQAMASYVDQTKRIQVANTEGLLAQDTQDLCRLNVTVVAQGKDGELRTGSFGGGGRVPMSHFDTFTPESVGQEAARQAIATLGAVEAPAGEQTVVLAPGWSGILLHEAIGHGLEADFIRKQTSLFAGKVGQSVASDKVTVIDDGTVANARGSLNIDDEGHPGERKVLIEKGILKRYMFDDLNAKVMGERSTGSGRRQSFKHPPMPRMTNTYLAPGDSTPEEVVRSVDHGIYCKHFGGGQVDISNGNFVFEVAEAYLIEKGQLTRPVKGATLIGIGPTVLGNISMVGCDAAHDPGMGTCGKDGQSVPVGVGLPTVRIDRLTVGGTQVGAKGRA